MTLDEPGRKNTGESIGLAAWGGLLVAEALGLSFRFDFGILWDGLSRAPWWQSWLINAGQLPRIATVAALAALLHGGLAWKDEVERLVRRRTTPLRVLIRLVPHALALTAFFVLTGRLVADDPSYRAGAGEIWVIAWLMAGLGTALTWLAIAIPPGDWADLARRRGGSLGAGLAIGLVAWGAGIATNLLWRPMTAATFVVVRAMIAPFVGGDLVSDPEHAVIGTSAFRVEIAPDCSGYEGIGLVWVILGAYLWIFRRGLRFPAALWLLPIGTVFIWITNAARIALLVALGIWFSPTVAVGGFHSQAGWLALNAVTLGLIAGSRRVGWMTRGADEEPWAVHENPSAAYLAPMMVLIAMVMIGTALSEGFDRLYPLRVVAVSATLWAYRRSYRGAIVSRSLSAVVLGVAVFALWMALEPPAGPAGAALLAGVAGLSPASRAIWMMARVVGSTVLVPIAEELAFRGFLARRLISADFESVDPGRLGLLPIVVSSILFGAVHQRLIAGTLAGLLLALAYRRRGRLGDAILAHSTANGLIAATVLLGGRWSLWA